MHRTRLILGDRTVSRWTCHAKFDSFVLNIQKKVFGNNFIRLSTIMIPPRVPQIILKVMFTFSASLFCFEIL